MNRRKFLQYTGLSFGAIALFRTSGLASILNDPAWELKMLTKESGIFIGKGGTILFNINKAGITVVDAQFPDTAGELIKDLQKKTTAPFKLLINTHHHSDHTSGNIAFKGLVENILAHENSLKNQQNHAKKNNLEEKQLYPNATYEMSTEFKVGNELIRLDYLGAGHTNGDSLVHFAKSDIVHVGDLVFNRRFPYIDKSNGADITNWIKILEQIPKLYPRKTKFVCGHAREGFDVVINQTDITLFKDYLGNAMTFVAKEVKEGKIKSEILSATSIPGSPEWKGDGIIRTLEAAYNEVTSMLN